MDSKAATNMIHQLCTQCVLCCDGTLFADVELEDESEEAVLESMGLAIDTDGPPVYYSHVWRWMVHVVRSTSIGPDVVGLSNAACCSVCSVDK